MVIVACSPGVPASTPGRSPPMRGWRSSPTCTTSTGTVTAGLEREGVQSFCASYHELLVCIESKLAAIAAAGSRATHLVAGHLGKAVGPGSSSWAGPHGGAVPYFGLLLERHRTRMAGTGPRSEQQENARVHDGLDFAALSGRELHQSPGLDIDRLAGVADDARLTVDDGDPGPLVDLVFLEHLAGGKVEHNRASLFIRGEDLRLMRPPGKAFEIPVIHSASQFCSSTNKIYPSARASFASAVISSEPVRAVVEVVAEDGYDLLAAQVDYVYAPPALCSGPVDDLPHRTVEVRTGKELLCSRDAEDSSSTPARLRQTMVDLHHGSLPIRGVGRLDRHRTFDARQPPDA